MDVGGSTMFDDANLKDNPVISDADASTVPPSSESEQAKSSESNPEATQSPKGSEPEKTSTADTHTEIPKSPTKTSATVSEVPLTPPISLSQDSAFMNLEKIITLPQMTPSVPPPTSTIDTPTSTLNPDNIGPDASEEAEFVEEEEDDADLTSGVAVPEFNLAPMVLDDPPPSPDEEDKIVNKRIFMVLQ